MNRTNQDRKWINYEKNEWIIQIHNSLWQIPNNEYYHANIKNMKRKSKKG